jgi:hypothetical protein
MKITTWVLALSTAGSNLALADPNKKCAQIQDRVFEVSGSYTVLGDKWFWTDSNVIVDRTDPAFKEEVIEAFKRGGQDDIVNSDFDEAFKKGSPEFMANAFLVVVGQRISTGSIGFKEARWLYFDKKHVCKTSPLECLSVARPDTSLLNQEKKEALSKFLKAITRNKIEEFCSDMTKKRDAVFLAYSRKTSNCAKPKWTSLEQYCRSIEKASAEVAAALR